MRYPPSDRSHHGLSPGKLETRTFANRRHPLGSRIVLPRPRGAGTVRGHLDVRRAGGAGSAPPAVALGAARATSEAARASRAPGAVSRARRHTDVAPSERRHECVPPAQAQSAGEPSATRHGCVATRRAWPMPHWTTGVGTGPTGNNTRRRRQRRGAMRVSFL